MYVTKTPALSPMEYVLLNVFLVSRIIYWYDGRNEKPGYDFVM